jgi:hypothetical protein
MRFYIFDVVLVVVLFDNTRVVCSSTNYILYPHYIP